MTAAPALRVQGVTKRYGEFVAVRSLSFEVPRGCIYGILGPNGAGKTTTLRMINDIIAADEGTIRILGDHEPGREAGRRIGYLPEERGLYPKMSVLDVLGFFGELRGLSGRDARARANRWLERLQLSDWRGSKVQELSKGMQQKVQFVTAVLHDPELLILDEPWSGLDPINAEVLRDIVLELKQAGKTILFSTHLMEQAEQLVDSLCIIARGQVVLEGELSAVKRAAAADRTVALVFGDDASERAAARVLADAALVAGTKPRKSYLEVELVGGDAADALLAALVGAGVKLRRFERVEPSLHQIFVDRVGEKVARGRHEDDGGSHVPA